MDLFADRAQNRVIVKNLQEEKRLKAKRKAGYHYIKRTADVALSAVSLVALSPVFLATAIAIYIEDGGPVFFVQERVGKDEKKFRMYKFRSMRRNADKIHEEMRREYQSNEVSFKLKDDPRITKTGRFIRKTNIDELPQLLNILRGEMSIVGPRPLPVYEYEEERSRYGDTYRKRYQVPQGLTCYWQVEERAETTFEERMQLDVQYASDCSARLDAYLTFKTMLAIIGGRAGY